MAVPDQAIRVLPLAIIGMSYAEIAEQTGMSKAGVQYWLDQLTDKGFVIDKPLVIDDMYGTGANGKRQRRTGRSSILTAKGVAYMLAMGAHIEEGTPIAVED